MEKIMDKSKKLSDTELDCANGGVFYVSIDGGEKIRARVGCLGGEMVFDYTENGVEKSLGSGIHTGNIIGAMLGTGLLAFESLGPDVIINISSKDEK